MAFFVYQQHNTGGSWVTTAALSKWVIIEAEDARQANSTAERIGMVFDGVEKGIDCACCGDRWYPARDDDQGISRMVTGEGRVKVMADRSSITDTTIYWHNGNQGFGQVKRSLWLSLNGLRVTGLTGTSRCEIRNPYKNRIDQ